jgi:hypothetical protein
MRPFLFLLALCLSLVAGCTTTPRDDKPKIHCPACGTELDAIFQKKF